MDDYRRILIIGQLSVHLYSSLYVGVAKKLPDKNCNFSQKTWHVITKFPRIITCLATPSKLQTKINRKVNLKQTNFQPTTSKWDYYNQCWLFGWWCSWKAVNVACLWDWWLDFLAVIVTSLYTSHL